jgi:putative membrane protein
VPQELQSPELQAWAAGFPLALLHAAVALALLMAGVCLYALITPHRDIQLIREGNAAAAISFGGVIVGLALPLAIAVMASTSFVDVAIWGLAALFLQLAVFRLTDILLHGLPQRIQEGELSAALLLVSAKLATAIVLAAAVAG